jgi:hypothetical protein
VLRNALEIFPNPATETVQVLDMLSRLVRQHTAQLSGSETVAMNLRGLPAGICAVRVQTAGVEYVSHMILP